MTEGRSPNTLMARNTGGLHVEINYLPTMHDVVLQVYRGGEAAAVTVTPEKALDAFHHPTLYLNARQVTLLFGERP